MKKVSVLFLVFVLAIFFTGCGKKAPTTPVIPEPPTPKPNIVAFAAIPATINRGTISGLLWEVTNSTSVEIDQGIGTVAPLGSCEIGPLWDIEYTLTATNGDLQAVRTCSVTVECGSDFVVTGPFYKQDRDSFTYYGTVTNYGTYEGIGGQLYMAFFAADGTQLNNGCADIPALKPGEQTNWEIYTLDYGQQSRKIAWAEYMLRYFEYVDDKRACIFDTGMIRVGK